MKGSITDFPVIMALLLSGALSIFLVYYVLSAMSSAWPVALTGAESAYVLTTGLAAFTVFDYMFIFLAVGLGLFTVVSGFFIDSHPIFFAFSVLLLLPIVILTSAQITNVFNEIAISADMVAVSNQFPYIVLFMRNLPLFFLVMGILVAIAVHGKPGGGSI